MSLHTYGFPATSLYHPHPYSSSEVKVNMLVIQCAWLLVAPWTVAHQLPLSVGFSRQEYWNGLPFSSPGNLPDPGIKPRSLTLQADSLPSEPRVTTLKVTEEDLNPALTLTCALLQFTTKAKVWTNKQANNKLNLFWWTSCSLVPTLQESS